MKKISFFLSALVLLNVKNKAQSLLVPFTNQNLLELNPSFAGSNGFLRNQTGVSIYSPNTYYYQVDSYNNAEVYLKRWHAGLAITYSNNHLSFPRINNNLVSFVYAQHLSFLNKKLKITPSLQFTYGRRHLDNTGYFFYEGDGFVSQWGYPRNQQIYYTKNYFDLSGGLLMNYKNFFIGSSYAHINSPDVGFYGTYRQPGRLRLHGSYNLKLSEKNRLQFFMLVNSESYFSYAQASVNALLFKHLIAGGGYLSNDIAFANLGYRNNYISTSVGFNKITSRLAGYSQPTWTFNLAWHLRNKELRKEITNFETW